MAYERNGNFIKRLADGAQIPVASGNKDYAEFLAWVASGHTPSEPVASPLVIPTSVTMRQGRLALLGAGLLDQVSNAVEALPDAGQRAAAMIEWEYAQTIERNSTFTQVMSAQLGLTTEQLDQLFLTASTL